MSESKRRMNINANKKTFAKTLRALMEDKHISQRALAAQLGLSFQAVSVWCTGKSYPECDMLLKIAAFFGESTDYLLTGVRPENKEAHELLGLSDEAIERLNFLHNDKELEKSLLPLVDDILSNPDFYNLLSAIIQLDFERKYSKHHESLHNGVSDT